MYKIQYSFFRKITLCCLLTTFILQAQTHVYNDVKIDSLTFANTRKELANISTEKFLKRFLKILLQNFLTDFCCLSKWTPEKNILWLLHSIILQE